MRTILEGQSLEEGQASHVHLLRARGCAVRTDFRSWALLQAAEELHVRRVRWYQSWAPHPKDHHTVVTAVLVKCRAEDMVGVRRLTIEEKCLPD